jgi:hypothetical protein
MVEDAQAEELKKLNDISIVKSVEEEKKTIPEAIGIANRIQKILCC